MKQYPLEHPMFDGYINGSAVHRRSLLRQLEENREIFKYCPSNILIAKIQNISIASLICILCILSTFTVTSLYESYRTRKIVINEIYTMGKRTVEENKMKAFKEHNIEGRGSAPSSGIKVSGLVRQ